MEKSKEVNKGFVEVESIKIAGKARFSKEGQAPVKPEKKVHKRPTPNRNFVKKQLKENVELVDQNIEQYYLNFNVELGEEGVSYIIDKNNLFHIERV